MNVASTYSRLTTFIFSFQGKVYIDGSFAVFNHKYQYSNRCNKFWEEKGAKSIIPLRDNILGSATAFFIHVAVFWTMHSETGFQHPLQVNDICNRNYLLIVLQHVKVARGWFFGTLDNLSMGKHNYFFLN